MKAVIIRVGTYGQVNPPLLEGRNHLWTAVWWPLYLSHLPEGQYLPRGPVTWDASELVLMWVSVAYPGASLLDNTWTCSRLLPFQRCVASELPLKILYYSYIAS